ncbi:aldehyde dehydrogenase family protein [Halomicrobium urmianum]|uniref:aldehyde dehydrogenase family protein n=1 Tax=Halomicrobium urmianum TaxID=1586233 RepID=UPI001CDA11F9|nr:aldehyde dehydrogenase family protein [Halomicrobium urmianum]
MTYELDATDDREAPDANDSGDGDDGASDPGGSGGTLDSSLGVTVPDEHVGAFVAQALEDPERATTWDDVVDAMVAPAARDAWANLSRVERAAEILSKAADYDERAIERFEAVPLDAGEADVRDGVDEGLRCRRNADTFRDGVAAAYGDGLLDDEAIVAALKQSAFETDLVGRREDLLERIDEVYDVEYCPYGGTLMDAEEGPEPETDHGETW